MSDLAQARVAEELKNISGRLEQIELLLGSNESNVEEIAESLHTANLIAYLAIVDRRKATDNAARDLENEVRRRLGLIADA